MEIKMYLDGNPIKVVCHGYKTKRVIPYILKCPREDFLGLEMMLAAKSGGTTDNHVVYEISIYRYSHIPNLYVGCSDSYIYFGTCMEEMIS